MNPTSVIWRTAIVVISGVLSPAHAGSYGPFTLRDFQAKGAFALVVDESKHLKSGASKLTTQSAYVTAHGLIPGNSDGLEIHFLPKPITEKIKTDILENDAKASKKTSYTALVLYLGKDNKIWRANLSYVIPGATVVRTVAWKPEDLQKYFSDVNSTGSGSF